MNRRQETLSSRERARLALEHRETDGIPMAAEGKRVAQMDGR